MPASEPTLELRQFLLFLLMSWPVKKSKTEFKGYWMPNLGILRSLLE
jgi:hypothetical protein